MFDKNLSNADDKMPEKEKKEPAAEPKKKKGKANEGKNTVQHG